MKSRSWPQKFLVIQAFTLLHLFLSDKGKLPYHFIKSQAPISKTPGHGQTHKDRQERPSFTEFHKKSGTLNWIMIWLALPVGNGGINLYTGMLGIHGDSFPTKGQLVIEIKTQ